jgi:hypothetical protein
MLDDVYKEAAVVTSYWNSLFPCFLGCDVPPAILSRLPVDITVPSSSSRPHSDWFFGRRSLLRTVWVCSLIQLPAMGSLVLEKRGKVRGG